MAKKSTSASSGSTKKKGGAGDGGATKPKRAVATTSKPKSERSQSKSDFNAADALLKLIESPLFADLLAVAATAAVAAITESRSGRRDDPDYRSGQAVKAAGKAAAAAVGRRLKSEFEDIRRSGEQATERGEA